jgi:hypothetical protein
MWTATNGVVPQLFWLLRLLVVQHTWLQQHAHMESSSICQNMLVSTSEVDVY